MSPPANTTCPRQKRGSPRPFKLDTKRTERLFTGKDHVIKTGISEQAAMEYAIKLAEIGCECCFERVVDAVVDDHSNDPDFSNAASRSVVCDIAGTHAPAR